MMPLTHEKAQDLILLKQEASPKDRNALSNHLAVCPDCRSYAALVGELSQVLPSVYPLLALSPHEIQARMNIAQPSLQKNAFISRFFVSARKLVWISSMAALFAVLFIVVFLVLPEGIHPQPGQKRDTLTPEVTQAATQTPQVTPGPDVLNSILQQFPLTLGSTWTYIYTDYKPDPNDPNKTVQLVLEITRTVTEVKMVDGSYYAHIKDHSKTLSQDPGWEAGKTPFPDSGDSGFWWIIQENRIYVAPNLDSPEKLSKDELFGIDFVFPLAKDAEWCPGFLKTQEAGPNGTLTPCQFEGKRVVQAEVTYQSPAGNFDRCYQIADIYNSGPAFQTFCEGVGLVEIKYDHAGTRFGFSYTLTSYKIGGEVLQPTVDSSSTPTPAQNTLTPTPSPSPQTHDEQVLQRAVLDMNIHKRIYCSWQILGQSGQALYAYAYCASVGDPIFSSASIPVVIMLDENGHYQEVKLPQSGIYWTASIQNLFPPDIQQRIFKNDIAFDKLEKGIQMRASGEIDAPYVVPDFPPDSEHCQWDTQRYQDMPATGEEGYDGWMKYSNSAAGFSINVPSDWSVEETLITCWNGKPEPHFLAIQSPDGAYQVTMGFRKPDQNIYITRTGTPAGDFTTGGTVQFMGKLLDFRRLQNGDRTMAVFYNGAAEFLANKMMFTLSLDIADDPKDNRSIPTDIEDLAARILASAKTDSKPAASAPALVEPAPFTAQAKVAEDLSMDLYRLQQPVSYDTAEEYGYDQVQARLGAQSHWGEPGLKGEWQARLDAANATLAAFNYRLVGIYAPPTPTEYTLFLGDQAILTSIESFSDVSVNKGITDFVMAVQVASQDGKLIRNGSITSWSTAEGWLHRSRPVYMGYDLLYADMESADGSQNVKVTVYRNTREIIYTATIQAKAPLPGLVNLWTFSDPWVDHWALELADSVVIDGQPVNELHKYQKSYEFHRIGGKPFYFFEKAGKVGVNYNGREIALNGSEVPHYNCCSSSLLNPRQKNNTLIFFMKKDQDWYYAEVYPSAEGRPAPTTTPSSEPTITPSQVITPTITLFPNSLVTPVPNAAGLTIEENEIVPGSIELDAGTWIPVLGTQRDILNRHAAEKQARYEFRRLYDEPYWVMLPLPLGHLFRALQSSSVGEDGLSYINVSIQKDGKEIFKARAGEVSPIDTLRGLWVTGEHWVLEIAFVKNIREGGMVNSIATGQVYQDGVLLNQQYGYDEMFAYQLLNGNPFYFYTKDEQVHVSYNDQDLPLSYDEVAHYRCCSAGTMNPVAAPNWIGFYGRRGETWYYVEILAEATSGLVTPQVTATAEP